MERQEEEEFYASRTCCKKPRMQNFPYTAAGKQYTNRLCLSCRAHWYGPMGEEIRYTAKEWEDYIGH